MFINMTQRAWTLAAAPTAASPKARKLVLAEQAIPTLSIPTGVLIKIHAFALAARDLQIRDGHYPAPHDLLDDLVPVGSAAAEIVAIGPEVHGWKVGDRCMPMSMPGHYYTEDLPLSSLQRSLGGARHGCAREYMVIENYEDLLPVASHLSWTEVASMGSASTAWTCLFGHSPKLLPGSTVLILGTGGVSLFSAQIALMSGSSVIITSSSDDKLAKVVELLQPMLNPSHGEAIRTINYNRDPNWEKTVLKMTNGRGVDHVVEVAGWATVGKCVLCTRKGGLVAVTGYLSTYGSVPNEIVQQGGSFIPAALTPDLSKMILYSAANVRGVFVGNRDQTTQMMRAVERSGLRPHISETFDFADLPKAYEALKGAKGIGKIVVKL